MDPPGGGGPGHTVFSSKEERSCKVPSWSEGPGYTAILSGTAGRRGCMVLSSTEGPGYMAMLSGTAERRG